MKTINVPLDELKPGDTVTIPPLTVDAILSGEPRFAGFNSDQWTSFDWLERSGATATREVPDEPEFSLDGRAAYNAMMDGAVIERVKYHNAGVFVRRKWCDGKFMVQWWFGKDAGRWGGLSWGGDDQNARWRIVEDENGN